MEVGLAFHRVMHHLNHARTACQGKNLADCLFGSVQPSVRACTHKHLHTHTCRSFGYITFLLKMLSYAQ